MASAPISCIRPYRQVRVEGFKEAASQTFKMGDALILGTTADTGHRVAIAADATTYIVGFAAQDATGTTDAVVSVWVADALGEFVGNICTASVGDVASDYNMIGDNAGLVPDTTNAVWRVDTNDTAANNVVKITGLYHGDTEGDTNGRVIFRVLGVANTAAARVF